MVWPLTGWWPLNDSLGSEFMPDLDEGDLLYMPSAFPAISIGKAQQILQQTDRLIRTVPEVRRVFGKMGRAETATDPAPLTMIETTIQLKPRDQWREGMTMDKLKRELDARGKSPGHEQRLGYADQEPYRHAGHRHKDTGRYQDSRTGPRRYSGDRQRNRACTDTGTRYRIGILGTRGRRSLHCGRYQSYQPHRVLD